MCTQLWVSRKAGKYWLIDDFLDLTNEINLHFLKEGKHVSSGRLSFEVELKHELSYPFFNHFLDLAFASVNAVWASAVIACK